jgi:hypothetical protein
VNSFLSPSPRITPTEVNNEDNSLNKRGLCSLQETASEEGDILEEERAEEKGSRSLAKEQGYRTNSTPREQDNAAWQYQCG